MTENQMLNLKSIRILPSVNDWQDAIHQAVAPLVTQGFVEPRYIQSIIDNTFQFGPYYVLAPEIALLHARPEQGVIKTQLGVTVLKKPIRFSTDGYNVRLLITLAAADSNTHLETLQALAERLDNQEWLMQVLNAKTPAEILTLFKP